MVSATGTRRSPRFPARHLVSFSRTRFGELVEPMVHLARTVDLSAGGARLETDSALAAGDHLTLQIAVGNQIVEVSATVVHVRPLDTDLYATGVEFDRLSDEERAALLGSA
jgi:hypothetical protein